MRHSLSITARSWHIFTLALVLVGLLPSSLRGQGSIVSWGLDNHGQVSNTPGGAVFTQVSGCWYHSPALRADGSIVSWGRDSSGQVSNSPGRRLRRRCGGYSVPSGLRGSTRAPPIHFRATWICSFNRPHPLAT